MKNLIKKFKDRKLRLIAEESVVQSYVHKQNIIDYFSTLVAAARSEFREDNKVTLDSFLQECFNEALKK